MDSDIKPLGVRMVATVLAFHANEQSGEAWPSHGTLAAACGGMHRDTVRHALKQLVREGVLEVAAVGSGGGHRATTRYRFLPEWVEMTGGRRTPGFSKPGVESSADRGSSDPRPGVDGPPKRDERKAKPSLSSKTAHTTTKGQEPQRGLPSLPPVAAPVARQAPEKTNSQQPLSSGNSRRPYTVPEWLRSPEGMAAKAMEVGIGPFDEATEPAGPGSAWGRYQLRLMKAAGHIKPSKPSRRESRA